MTTPNTRMPVAFVTHGGGPWPVLDVGMGFPVEERNSLLAHLREVSRSLPERPKALVVISAHWEEAIPTVMSSPAPPMLFDYSGFPREAYAISWPAPGSPVLARHVRGLLEKAGFTTSEDPERGYDHGTFVPLKVAYPEADIPVVQLSLIRGLDPKEHLRMGRALAPLRDEGVFVITTGNTFHNLYAMRDQMMGHGAVVMERAVAFDEWLIQTVSATPEERDARLAEWKSAPGGRYSHPREEHLIPLMVAAGAAGSDVGVTSWRGGFSGLPLASFQFG